MSPRYREGSRVQQVWEKFESEGPEKAFDFGLTLELKDNTLRAWIRGWAKENGKTADGLPTNRPAGKSTTVPRLGKKQNQHSLKPRVYDIRLYNNETKEYREGILLIEGEEVSEIKWDDGLPYDQYTSNEYIYDVKTKKNHFGLALPKQNATPKKSNKVIVRYATGSDDEPRKGKRRQSA